MAKGKWPNLGRLWISQIVFNLGGNEGSPGCLTYLKEADWELFESQCCANYRVGTTVKFDMLEILENVGIMLMSYIKCWLIISFIIIINATTKAKVGITLIKISKEASPKNDSGVLQ